MVCIEQVMSKVSTLEQEQGRDKTIEIEYVLLSLYTLLEKGKRANEKDFVVVHSADTEFYQIQHEKSRLVHDKEALQTMYQDLLEEHHQLKEEHVRLLSLFLSSCPLSFPSLLVLNIFRGRFEW